MLEYSTYYNGEYTHVYDLDKCIKAIQCRNADNEQRIEYLEKENKKLKDEAYKDNELQDMKNELERTKDAYYRGFPITKKEESIIKEWMKNHDEEVHGIKTQEDRIMAGGCIGGRYSYHFIPTSIGTIGTVKCSCGAEFNFQEIF